MAQVRASWPVEPHFMPAVAKARNADNSSRAARGDRSAFGHARERRPHLAACAQQQNIAIEPAQCFHHTRGGFAEQSFQFLDASYGRRLESLFHFPSISNNSKRQAQPWF